MNMRYYIAAAFRVLCLMSAAAPPPRLTCRSPLGSLYGVDPGNTVRYGQGYSISPNGNVAGTAYVQFGSENMPQYTTRFFGRRSPKRNYGIDGRSRTSRAPNRRWFRPAKFGAPAASTIAGKSWATVQCQRRHARVPLQRRSMYDLGCLGSDETKLSRAYAINATGQVAGTSDTTADGYSHASKTTNE